MYERSAAMKLGEKQKKIISIAAGAIVALAIAFAVLIMRIDNISTQKSIKAASLAEPYIPEFVPSPVEKTNEDASHTVSDEYTFSWFDDAIFIGDSRTEGLFLYSGIAELTKATPYAIRGFTTFDIQGNEKFKSGSKYVTAIEKIKENPNFSKAYINLGVNELSPGGSEDFIKRYDEIVCAVLEASPSARIIIQSIIPLTSFQSSQSSYVNNENTKEFNDALEKYADEKGFLFLDTCGLLSDTNGALSECYALSDGIHLTVDACKKWFDFLCYYTYF